MESCWQDLSSERQSSVVMCSLVISSLTPHLMSTTLQQRRHFEIRKLRRWSCRKVIDLIIFQIYCDQFIFIPGILHHAFLYNNSSVLDKQTASTHFSPSACLWRWSWWRFWLVWCWELADHCSHQKISCQSDHHPYCRITRDFLIILILIMLLLCYCVDSFPLNQLREQ